MGEVWRAYDTDTDRIVASSRFRGVLQGVPVPECFDIEVTRDGRWWMVYVPAIDQLTQARRRGEVELMARELIAVSTDRRIDEVAVRVVGEVPDA